MTRPLHALVLGLTLCALAPASIAALLETRGQPEPNVITMTTYGVDVATGVGLRSVLPPGWQLYIHSSVNLPNTMTWKLGDKWTAVMAEFATRSGTAVLIDWDTRSVFLRTPELALEEGAKKEEIAQAATTPLPKFSDAVTESKAKERDAKRRAKEEEASRVAAKQQEAEAQRQKEEAARTQLAARTLELERQQQSAQAALANVPVIRVNPTPQMVEKQAAAAKGRPVALASTSEFRYTKPVALNKPSARSVAQGIANRFNLRLVWAAPEIQLRGPVTLLAESPEQDAHLLQKALGVFSPVVLEVSVREKVLRVLPRHLQGQNGAVDALAAQLAPEPAPAPVEDLLAEIEGPATTAPAAAAGEVAAPVSTAATPARAEPVTPKLVLSKPKLKLVIGEKEPLEDALVRFARSQGHTVEWKVTGGFEANRLMQFEGSSIAELLSQLLPKLGLSADIYTRDKHIVVRPGDAAHDR